MPPNLPPQLRTAREEAAAAGRKAAGDVEADKRSMHEQLEKLKQDVAKRTQTVLGLTTDLEIAGRARAAAEAEASALAVQLSQLQREVQDAIARAVKAEEAASNSTAAANSLAGSVTASDAAAASLVRPATANPAAAMPPKPPTPGPRALSAAAGSSSANSRRSSDSGSGDPTRAVRALQTELAEARWAWCSVACSGGAKSNNCCLSVVQL